MPVHDCRDTSAVSIELIQKPTTDTRSLDRELERLSGLVSSHLDNFIDAASPGDRMEELIGAPFWRYEPQAFAKAILEPVSDMLRRASKKWRPIFAILMLEALECDSTRFEPILSLTLELTHTAALIIDDIEDESELRRGDTCIHIRYGTDIAINAANFLYFVPFQEILRHEHLSDRQKLLAHGILSHCYLRGHIGQATDLWRWRFPDETSLAFDEQTASESILQTYADKTACAVEAAMDLVAVIANLDDEHRKSRLRDFARSIGVGFQIMDDVNNYSAAPDWTKTVAEDLASGKMTYVIFRALQLLSGDRRAALRSIVSDARRHGDSSRLSEGIELVRESGALTQCQQEAHAMLRAAWSDLCKHVPDSHARRCIHRLCTRIFCDLNSV